MWKIAVLACLLAVCTAQTPPRPKISEAFEGMGESEIHIAGEPALFGNFLIAWNMNAKMGLENITFQHTTETEKIDHLLIGTEEYNLRIKGADISCAKSVYNGTYSYWGWVQYAKYQGKKEIHEREYDFWGYEVQPGYNFELMVEQDEPDVPVIFNRKSQAQDINLSFRNYTAGAPPSSIFEVPYECKDKRQRRPRKMRKHL